LLAMTVGVGLSTVPPVRRHDGMRRLDAS